jgi:hypothetical protein
MADALRGVIRDSVGRPVAGVLAKVVVAGTVTLAALFSDEALTAAITNDGLTSPLTEADGSYGPYYVGNGKYDLIFSKAGYTFDASDAVTVLAYDETALRTTAIATTLTSKDNILVVDASGGALAIQIALLANFAIGRAFTVIKKDASANAVTILGIDGTINGAASFVLASPKQGVTFRKLSGTEWVTDFRVSGPKFFARASVDQVVTTTVDAKVNFAVEDVDTNVNFVSPTFTPTVPGHYFFSAGITVTGTTVTKLRVFIKRNGVSSSHITEFSPLATSTTVGLTTFAGPIFMNGSTDFMEVFVNATGTGTLNVSAANVSSFSGFYLP